MSLFEQTATLFTVMLLYMVVLLGALPGWFAVVLAALTGAALLRRERIKNPRKKSQLLMLSLGVLIVFMFAGVLMR